MLDSKRAAETSGRAEFLSKLTLMKKDAALSSEIPVIQREGDRTEKAL